MTTNDLFETISEGLARGESNGNFGVSEGLLNPEDIDCSEALAALETLRQRIADLEAFYMYCENNGSVMKKMVELRMLASNHDSWKEQRDYFETLVKRCHGATDGT